MKYYYAVGRRKRSTATVRLYKGKGDSMFNDSDPKKLFNLPAQQARLMQPFNVISDLDFHYTIKASGGGVTGQLDAAVLAISRALVEYNPEFKNLLKKEKLLTRDDRKVERKKTGLKKARKSPQFSKR